MTAEPSSWVVRHAPWIPSGGPVLDLACGTGRHTRLFLERGHAVTAVDVEPSRLSELGEHPAIDAVAADLENAPWPLPGRRFAGVVVTNYLWRPLFPDVVASVAVGGTLIYDTFARGQERFGRPRRAAFLLEPGELLDVVRGALTVVAFAQGVTRESGAPAMRQRLVAVRGAAGGD